MNIVRTHLGAEYLMIGETPYTRRDGSRTTLLTWQGECATCGDPFLFKTPAGSAKFQPNRRCQRHKRPGQRVGGVA